MSTPVSKFRIAQRFRSFLPVIVDVETGGFNPDTDALLEIAAVTVEINKQGRLQPSKTYSTHVVPFAGSNIDPKALEINHIKPDSPLRNAKAEREALVEIFKPIRTVLKEQECTRAILVGHNAGFDLSFLNAAIKRTGIKRNPFHPFSNFDTVTLGGLAYGQTVLARAAHAAGIEWDTNQAHSAVYDAEKTAELFCRVINKWDLSNPELRTQLSLGI